MTIQSSEKEKAKEKVKPKIIKDKEKTTKDYLYGYNKVNSTPNIKSGIDTSKTRSAVNSITGSYAAISNITSLSKHDSQYQLSNIQTTLETDKKKHSKPSSALVKSQYRPASGIKIKSTPVNLISYKNQTPSNLINNNSQPLGKNLSKIINNQTQNNINHNINSTYSTNTQENTKLQTYNNVGHGNIGTIVSKNFKPIIEKNIFSNQSGQSGQTNSDYTMNFLNNKSKISLKSAFDKKKEKKDSPVILKIKPQSNTSTATKERAESCSRPITSKQPSQMRIKHNEYINKDNNNANNNNFNNNNKLVNRSASVKIGVQKKIISKYN